MPQPRTDSAPPFGPAPFEPDSYMVADVVPSPNFDDRKGGPADILLLHYTGMRTGDSALERLTSTESKVSSHYVVFEDGRIVQCVPEDKRAWHAGVSFWAGETDINSRSVGIEIVNPGHEFGYTDFPRRQTAAVITLFLIGGVGGLAATTAVNPNSVELGAVGAALALACAWATPDLLRLRAGEDVDGDLIGAAVIAAAVAVMPLAVTDASWVADGVGVLAGFAIGLPLALVADR